MDSKNKNLNQNESGMIASVFEDMDMDAGYYVSGKGIEYPTMNAIYGTNDVITVTSGDTISLGGLSTGTNTFSIYPPPEWAKQSGKICLTGDEADIEINGKSLIDTLDAIEQRLNILTPNLELEAEWEELKELGNQYRDLEQRIKAKQDTWNKLVSVPPPPPPENW